MIIGVDVKTGKDVEINLKSLVKTRMILEANSGGGKSWAGRRIMEQTFDEIQHIIIDPEGEYHTLREKYDYLLIGDDGDIPLNMKSAELLAKRIMKLKVSTIIDLSEFSIYDRCLFVKKFLDSLMSLKREFWTPCLVFIDEAHDLCPESKSGKAESKTSVINLMTKGRKRGYSGILMTQRVSKLAKDASAEGNNKLSGRKIQDLDRKRAAEELGFTSKEAILSLRKLPDGNFFAFGPSISDDVIQIKVGKVLTTHEDIDGEISKLPTTPEKIKEIMKEIGDLPKQAEVELKTTKELKDKIKELKTKLTIAERSNPRIDLDSLNKAKQEIASLRKENSILIKRNQKIGEILNVDIALHPVIDKYPAISNRAKEKPISSPPETHLNGDSKPLRAGAMKILGWLAGAYPKELTKQRIATLSGFSVKGGTFNTYISELKRNGWISGSNELSITDEGLHNAEARDMPSGDELLKLWMSKFRAGAGKILQCLYDAQSPLSKEEIGYQTGFEPSGGTFNTYLSELRRNGLITVEGDVEISQEFFE